MKKHFLSCLLLVLTLICAVFYTAACDNGNGEDNTTTNGDTDAVTTDAVTDAPAPSLSAADVDALIAAIDGATLENEEKMDEAYLAYCSLSDEEKAKVTGFDTLQAYRYELTKSYVVKEYLHDRMPHHEFVIGAYGLPASNDTVMQALVDCHFDFVWNGGAYDHLKKYGLGSISPTWAIDISYNEFMTEEEFREIVKDITRDHEVVWGVDHMDEPKGESITNYWNTAKVMADTLFPQSDVFMNFNPYYGYANDMAPFCADLDTYFELFAPLSDIATFDHYVYMTETPHHYFDYTAIASLLDNLSVFSRYCRQYDQDMIVIAQHSDPWDVAEPKYELTADQIKFQAYTSMAYGAKGVVWYCTVAWAGFITDEDGARNEMFDKLEEANGDLKALEPVFMRYSAASDAVLMGSKYSGKKNLTPYQGNTDVSRLTKESLTDLAVDEKSAMLVGHFEKNVGEGEAFMLVGLNNYRFTKDQTASVTFKTADPDAVVTAYVKGVATRLTPDANGVYTVEVVNADGVFVTVD